MLMNKISKFLLIFLILLQAGLLHADDLRVVVMLAIDKEDGKDMGRKVSILCSEAVIQSKGFRYISPTETAKIMTKNEKIAVNKVINPEKEYSAANMEYLEKASKPYENQSLDNLSRLLESIDIMITGSAKREGPLVKVDLTMANGKNRRQYDIVFECEESRLDAEVHKKIMHFLKAISGPLKVYADRLVSEKDSVVAYLVRTMSNADITMEVNYTGNRPDPEIQDVSLLPPDSISKDGVTTYQVKSDSGKVIDMEFTFKSGKLYSVKVDTPMPDPSKKTKQSEILTIKSKAGYALKFDFMWDKGEMQYAKLYPALNPFGDYD
jgi:hypothetical protein